MIKLYYPVILTKQWWGKVICLGKNKFLYGIQYLIFMALIVVIVLDLKIAIIALAALNGLIFFIFVGATFKYTDEREKKSIKYFREMQLDINDTFKDFNSHLDAIHRSLNIFQNSLGIMDDVKMLSENMLMKVEGIKSQNASSNSEMINLVNNSYTETMKNMSTILNKYDFQKILGKIYENIELLKKQSHANHNHEMESIQKFIESMGSGNCELKEILQRAQEEIIITKKEGIEKLTEINAGNKDEMFTKIGEVKDELNESLKEVLDNTETSIDNIKSELVEEFSKFSSILELLNTLKENLEKEISNNGTTITSSMESLTAELKNNKEDLTSIFNDNTATIIEQIKQLKYVKKTVETIDTVDTLQTIESIKPIPKLVEPVKELVEGVVKVEEEGGVKYILGDKVIKYEEKDGTTTEFKYNGDAIEQSKIKKHGDLVMVVNFNNGNIVEAKHYTEGKVVNRYIYNELGELIDSIDYSKEIAIDTLNEPIQDTKKISI